jgi:hypothetical protein
MNTTAINQLNNKIQTKWGFIATSVLMLTLLCAFPAFSAGLEDATDAVNEIKDWAYIFLGAFIFVFLIYHVIMAMMDKETWADVMMALVKVAIAGGVIVAAEWAWAIFGG